MKAPVPAIWRGGRAAGHAVTAARRKRPLPVLLALHRREVKLLDPDQIIAAQEQPGIAQTQDVLDDLPGAPRVMAFLDLDDEHRTTLSNGLLGAAQHCKLVTFDIHLDDADVVEAVVVLPAHLDLQRPQREVSIRVLVERGARFDRTLPLVRNEQCRRTRLVAQSDLQDLDRRTEAVPQLRRERRQGLECDHLLRFTMRGERKQADVRPDIDRAAFPIDKSEELG